MNKKIIVLAGSVERFVMYVVDTYEELVRDGIQINEKYQKELPFQYLVEEVYAERIPQDIETVQYRYEYGEFTKVENSEEK